VTPWVNYWFNNNPNIGDGIRSMLQVRLAPSNDLAMVERMNVNATARQGSGTDVMR
jgi:curli biogenesis system outer membrane secretion channel CsgG